MPKYLVENTGQVEQHVGPTAGPYVKLAMGQNMIGEFDDEAVDRMRSATGLRITERRDPTAKQLAAAQTDGPALNIEGKPSSAAKASTPKS